MNSQSSRPGIVLGCSSTSRKGKTRKNQRNVRIADVLVNGSNTAPTMRPTAKPRARLNAFAASIVRRAIPFLLPNSIWATTGHTEPGRYLPSTKKENAETARPRGSNTQANQQLTPEHEGRA